LYICFKSAKIKNLTIPFLLSLGGIIEGEFTFMTRLEKIQLAISKGITYNEKSGDVIGVKGNVLRAKDNQGYIYFGIWKDNKTYRLYAHQFAWFIMYNECIDMIDHENRIKTDNRKLNLRKATRCLNSLNRDSFGATFDKKKNKWIAQIMIDGKNKNLGRFELKIDAQNKYNEYKQKIIKNLIK